MQTPVFFETQLGRIYNCDSLRLMQEQVADDSVNLIMTSPPFGLVRKKSYGNVESEEYVAWFKQFGLEFKRISKQTAHSSLTLAGRGWRVNPLGHFINTNS